METNPRPADPAAKHEVLRKWKTSATVFDHVVQQGYPAGLIDFIPAIPQAWSVRDHLCHVLDADLMLQHRIKYAIAEPGTTIPVWDPEAWQATLGYRNQSATLTVSLYRLLRLQLADTLTQLDGATWSASWSVHPVRGPMNLEDWLTMYVAHVDEHLGYLARNEAAWNAKGGDFGSCCGG